jgi:carbon-monoxide dehydrogenase medium subunit
MSLYPQYARPRSLDQASQLLSNLAAGAVIIAGGQEIMPSVNYGHLMPSVYIDIGGLKDLEGIEKQGDEIAIGALTVHRDLQKNSIVQDDLPLLANSALQVGGGWQVHNRGTIGGNIVSMHPLYDILPSLIALGAEVEVVSSAGKRRIALSALLRETTHGLGSEAILSRVFITRMDKNMGWAYEKLKITAGGYGSANAAAVISMKDGRFQSLKVAVGAVCELPVDVSDALSDLVDREWSSSLKDIISTKCMPLLSDALSDHQGDAEWRQSMGALMASRAVSAAVECCSEKK